MKGRLVLYHPHPAEAEKYIRDLETRDWQIESTALEGAQLVDLVKKTQPDALIISLERSPAQGREAGRAIFLTTETSHIPIIFVGGQEDDISLLQPALPQSIFTDWEALEKVLSQIIVRW